MSLNLDTIVDRENTGSIKHKTIKKDGIYSQTDLADAKYGEDRVLQLWVADMDFPVAQPILDALHAKVDETVFGYYTPEQSFFESVVNWCGRRYNWEIDKDWIKLSPGVVPALYIMMPQYTKPGDKVIVQRPIYPPFVGSIEAAGCEVVSNDLVYDAATNRYEMDFDDLEAKASDPDCTAAILCSPHNPVGRVWTREELVRFADICLRNNVLIISDEIHCDLIYDDHKFVAMASISEEIADRTITCMASSKTFNLASLKNSQIIISNEELRQKFADAIANLGLHGSNGFGPVATEAAYNHGEEWLDNVLKYIQENYIFVRDYFAEHIPQLNIVKPEGTYLLWVDFSGLGLSQTELVDKLLGDAKVHFNDGVSFGPETGKGFMRINIASSRPLLKQALDRMAKALG